MSHAILSPSAASRWLACTPSARLELTFPENTSEAAEEGTLAHSLAELILSYRLKRLKRYKYEKQLAKIKDNELYDETMLDYVEQYADYVLEQYNAALATTPDAQIILETLVDLSEYVPEGYGTVDVRIIGDSTLRLIDLKYGKGVRVSAQGNKQLRLYALGALRECDFLYDIDTVELTIYQPRLDAITTDTLAVTELNTWAKLELFPRAMAAFDGTGEHTPGEHCRFCKARGVCKALASANLEIDKYENKTPHLLSDEEIADILDRAEGLKNWLTAVEDYAVTQASNHGKEWPGYKIVEKGTKRKYSDEAGIITALTEAGFNADDVAPRGLLALTNLEKKIGKVAFREHATPRITKPKGAPTLAPLSDPRPLFDANARAAQDFA